MKVSDTGLALVGHELAASPLATKQSGKSAPTAVSLHPEGSAQLPKGREFKLVLEDVQEANELKMKGTNSLVANMTSGNVSSSVEGEN